MSEERREGAGPISEGSAVSPRAAVLAGTPTAGTRFTQFGGHFDVWGLLDSAYSLDRFKLDLRMFL